MTSAFKSPAARAAVLASYDLMLSRWPVSHESRFVDTQFGTTHVVVCGVHDAPALLLLHGGGGNATMWFANVAALSRHFRVYAVDTIGDMGKSAETRPAPASEEYVHWLRQVMDALSLSRAHLCGASHGGWLACRFAASQPQRIAGLVLLAPAFLIQMRPAFLLRGLFAAIMPKRFIVMRFFRYITSARAHQAPQWALDDLLIRAKANRLNRQTVPNLTDDDLRKLPRHTLLLLGADDPIYDVQQASARVAALAPSTQIVVVPNAGHVLAVEQPDFVNDRICASLTPMISGKQ